jgi:hypothetical protein
MVSQKDRKEVKLLLGECDRLDLKKHIGKVWEDLPEEEKTTENCADMLICLFPEKKNVAKVIEYGTDEEPSWEEYDEF